MWQGIKNIYHLFVAFLAHARYGFPGRKLNIIGITGTSGKTTTTHMVYEILKEAGHKVSMLSTIKAVIGGKEYDTGFHVTTPDPHVLPKFLHEAVKRGDTHFVLEVSSHALHQNRTAFVPFAVGILTSLAHEHLDYHKTFAKYAKAKSKLLHAAKVAVVQEGAIKDEIKNHINFNALEKKVKTFGLTSGHETQTKWNLSIPSSTTFNILNGLAAATALTAIGIKTGVIQKALSHFVVIPGRYEEIPTKKNFRVIIDFAHKPDALEHVLLQAKGEVKNGGRVIVMYGCASERDTLKRPMMGEISARLADVTVLTDEDPRREDSMKIINEIGVGCEKGGAKEIQSSELNLASGFWTSQNDDEIRNLVQDDKKNRKHIYFKIPNRQEAITFIIQKLAGKGDIILLCGKGHEGSMNYDGKETLWSEHEAVRKALGRKMSF